jgi:hypothetical protein
MHARLADARSHYPAPVYARYGLSLDGGVEGTWRRVEGPVRTKIRRAREAGLGASWHGAEGLDGFYALYVATMRRLGSPPHGREWFAALVQRYRCEASIVLIRHREEAVAGAFVLRWRDWMGFPWAGSSAASFTLRPNNLLFWSIVERACAEGLARLDLGRSPLGAGPAHFKRGFGAEEQPLHYVCLRPDGRPMPALSPRSSVLRAASAAWGRLPPSVAMRCGPIAARWLT